MCVVVKTCIMTSGVVVSSDGLSSLIALFSMMHSALYVLQNMTWMSVRRIRITATRTPFVPTLTTRSLAVVTMASPGMESSVTVS